VRCKRQGDVPHLHLCTQHLHRLLRTWLILHPSAVGWSLPEPPPLPLGTQPGYLGQLPPASPGSSSHLDPTLCLPHFPFVSCRRLDIGRTLEVTYLGLQLAVSCGWFLLLAGGFGPGYRWGSSSGRSQEEGPADCRWGLCSPNSTGGLGLRDRHRRGLTWAVACLSQHASSPGGGGGREEAALLAPVCRGACPDLEVRNGC
jgi:hypothetical protein